MGELHRWLPDHVWNEERRDREFPELVARERERDRLAAEAKKRPKPLTMADYETPIASEQDRDEVKW